MNFINCRRYTRGYLDSTRSTSKWAPDLEIVSLETDDPAKMLKEFATSNHTWAVRFREYTNKA